MLEQIFETGLIYPSPPKRYLVGPLALLCSDMKLSTLNNPFFKWMALAHIQSETTIKNYK
jgi:hypothetical protein